MPFLGFKYAEVAFAARALPRTPLEAYGTPPDPIAGFTCKGAIWSSKNPTPSSWWGPGNGSFGPGQRRR